MNYYWEDATKRIQEELNDPLLRVEFNSLTQKYEVLKWMPRTAHVPVWGFHLGSSDDVVYLGYSDGLYRVQMTFDQWDNRVFTEMRRGRPDRKTVKEIIQEFKDDEYKVQKSLDQDHEDLKRETVMDMHKRLCPTIVSYSKEGIAQ